MSNSSEIARAFQRRGILPSFPGYQNELFRVHLSQKETVLPLVYFIVLFLFEYHRPGCKLFTLDGQEHVTS